MEPVILLFALILRVLLSIAVGYVAEELGHSGVIWGLLAFFLLGIWAFVFLIIWYLITGE